ncbi:MAG: TIGR04282 family arsenosugar biosynthesis glycosyltransferase [Deltaproteobacteria bacterium]|nr:TIGR04282 family arsenosugar biosynthesis glycosyltransferase [Deltaproteobacteria bacterium]
MANLTIIFAKEPVPGQVKTRLSPPLSPEMACRLYHCFLEDIIDETVRLPGVDVAIAYTPVSARGFFQSLAHPGICLLAQEGRDLGERQARAFAWGFARGYEVVLLRGSDTPDLPGNIILEAVEKLAAGIAQVVLGPSKDGGYYLIGLKNLHSRLFDGLSWSTGSVLTETLSRAQELDLTVHLLPYWRDIDTYADLVDFLKRSDPALRAGRRSVHAARELVPPPHPV